MHPGIYQPSVSLTFLLSHAKNMRYVLKMQTRARKYMNKLQMTMLRDIL